MTRPESRRSRRVSPGPMLVLAVVWVLLWGNFSWGNVIAGLLVGALVLALFPMPPVALGIHVRPWPLLVLMGRFARDLVVAAAEVAWKSTAWWYQPHGRFVTVDLRSREDLFITITASFCSLVPGSLVVATDRATGRMDLHVFDAPHQADVDAAVQRALDQEARVLRALARTGVPQ